MIAPADARAWCQQLASMSPGRRIDREGARYLDRYYLAGWRPGVQGRMPALYLHHFLQGDATDQTHTHPWSWSAGVILTGGYREHRCDAYGNATSRDFLPGDMNVIGADTRHRIELLDRDCWTLFLAAPFAQPWTFHDDC